MSLDSGLFSGTVMHQRLLPLRHRLRYRVFSLLVDLDDLPALPRRLRLLSVDRFNLFSLRQADHGDGSATPLKAQVEQRLRDNGLATGGAVRLLAMPRILGYAFNPLSVYFCHRPDGPLQAILYEVNNTFGQRHSYLIPVDEAQAREAAAGGVIAQRCDKQLYVSPFLGMDLHYRFRVHPPAERLALSVNVHRDDGTLVLAAQLDARRRPLTDGVLLGALATHPLLTLKVIAAIHWEALKLWLKGARLQPRPAPPAADLTVVPASLPAPLTKT
ncbi:DUF1365 domain-containing protein [Aquabacterium sp. J223]|uniref:DUF1365 domain-containing protein n=1 Tax=Aquabacterium sp. J223 TaxID=2898431 RepID=UPI0021AE0E49|nr:DUF1365 family protein [Aquabacterium sp. J223]UUX94405.1 DUF1365 family protein [Aquabacterium sp. J223]